MRAIVRDESGLRLVTNHREPKPAPGEALIRPVRVAIGGTDLEISRGMLGFIGVLGSEFVGIVERVDGPFRNELRGRRVVGTALSICGECRMCMSGLGQHCRSRTLMGIAGRDGCLADRFTLPVHNLCVIPETLDDDHAVFAETVAAALQAVRQLTIEGKPYITVLGDGPLGLVMVQLMAKLNASVRLIGRYSEKLSICEKWGIKHRHVDDIGRRADQDIVVDATGSPDGLELAMRLVRPRGKIVMKTMLIPVRDTEAHRTIRTGKGWLDLNPLVMNEIELIGSHRGPIGEAVEALARREVDVVSLISRRMSLDDGPQVFRAAGEPGALRVLVNI